MKKKNDLKKLALMGITGGVMMASGTLTAAEGLTNISTDNYLAAKSCGSKCGGSTAFNSRNHGCGASCGGATAYNSRNHSCGAPQDPTTYSQPDNYPQSQGSCGGRSPAYQQRQGSCGGSQSGYNQRQGGCGGGNSGRYYPSYFADNSDKAVQDTATQPMTESDFKTKLSPQGKIEYDKLSPEGKAQALKMASHDCSGKNDCKGQNACKTDKNACAGQGGCKGQSKCAMTPEQSVKVSSLKDKRASLNTRSSQNNYR